MLTPDNAQTHVRGLVHASTSSASGLFGSTGGQYSHLHSNVSGQATWVNKDDTC